jgi:hypothetical protein
MSEKESDHNFLASRSIRSQYQSSVADQNVSMQCQIVTM